MNKWDQTLFTLSLRSGSFHSTHLQHSYVFVKVQSTFSLNNASCYECITLFICLLIIYLLCLQFWTTMNNALLNFQILVIIHTCITVCVEVKGKLVRVNSYLLLCESWGRNPDHLALAQVPLSAEPSCWTLSLGI